MCCTQERRKSENKNNNSFPHCICCPRAIRQFGGGLSGSSTSVMTIAEYEIRTRQPRPSGRILCEMVVWLVSVFAGERYIYMMRRARFADQESVITVALMTGHL